MSSCLAVPLSRTQHRLRARDWHRLRDAARPTRRVGEEDRRTDQERDAGRSRTPATILVVDDDPNVRRMIARMLQAEDFTIVEAADGLQAMDQCTHHAVAVVVTDVRMPRMGGFELARHIAETWPHVQMLFVTAYPDADAGEFAGRTLTKPFNPDEFVAIVRSLADKYQG